MLLRHLLDQGLSKAAIAARLGVSRRVIYYWLAAGQRDRDVSAAPPLPRKAARRAQVLDPYVPIITARLEAYSELSGVRLLAECRAAGYTGGITQLRALVATLRLRPAPEPVVRFETGPGHQAQVDFATVRFPWGTRYALLVVLGYSRLLWVRFYPRQTMQVLVHGLEDAFAAFGGVPRELLFDQLKAVVIADERPDGGRLLENPEFLRFAAHWGFRIRACRPYRAQTKGKVERPIRYLRESFVYGREILGDGDLDAQVEGWLADVANARVHATTREVPRERFTRDEQAVLQPLAPRPYRPLVLPAARGHATAPVGRLTSRPTTPSVSVERRPLAAYARLAEEIA